MQLMQQYVQKSRRTIFPLRSAILIGLAVLSQAMPPSNSGAAWSWRFLGDESVEVRHRAWR